VWLFLRKKPLGGRASEIHLLWFRFSLYQILPTLSVTLFERTPILQALQAIRCA
jgi:hypothetical protein